MMAMMNASEGFGQSLSFGPNAVQATAASNRILDARETRLTEKRAKHDIPDTEGGIEIEFRDVRLRYPARETPVLDGLNMTIEKGKFAALVGASGCGKTSILSLLERFYEPEKGQIFCNGKDISDVDVYTFRRHLSLVAQEPNLMQGQQVSPSQGFFFVLVSFPFFSSFPFRFPFFPLPLPLPLLFLFFSFVFYCFLFLFFSY